MRVLIVSHNYPRFSDDPAGAFVATIARAALRNGSPVAVVAPHAAGLPTREEDNGIQVTRFRYGPDPLEMVAYRGGMRRSVVDTLCTGLLLPSFLFAFWRAVRRTAREFRADVVHAHWWFPGGWVSRGVKQPVILTCHGSDVRLVDRHALLRQQALHVANRAVAVTAVSGFLARDLARSLGTERDIVVTPMPIDTSRFRRHVAAPKANPPQILFAGNLVASKGVDLVIRAFARVRAKGIGCQLRILGDGPERRRLAELVLALGVEEAVRWSGFVTQAEMPAAYAESTVTVLASRGNAEGLGLTLVEALLTGCAVVGTNTGGIPEVVSHEETGLLAAPDDPVDLGNQLERLLTDEGLRERLTAAGRDRVQATHSEERAVRPFLELYDEAVAHRTDG